MPKKQKEIEESLTDDSDPSSTEESEGMPKKQKEIVESSTDDSDPSSTEESEGSSGSGASLEGQDIDQFTQSVKLAAYVDDGEGSSAVESTDDEEAGSDTDSGSDDDDVNSSAAPSPDALNGGGKGPYKSVSSGRRWSFIRATRDVKKFKELDDPIWNPKSMRSEVVSKEKMKECLNTIILQKFANPTCKNRTVMLLVDDTKATMRAFKEMSLRLKKKDNVLLVTVRPLMKTGKLTQKISTKALKYQYNLWRNAVLMQRQYATLLMNANVDFCAVTPMFHSPLALIRKMVKDYNVYGLYIGVHNSAERGKSQVRATGITNGIKRKMKKGRFHTKLKANAGCRVRLVE